MENLKDELFAAVKRGDVERVREILVRQPDLVKARTEDGGSTPLHIAAASGQLEVAKELLARGADVAARDSFDRATPLHLAADRGDLAMARLLVEHGSPVSDQEDLHGCGPLGWASVLDALHPEMARFLISAGAEPDIFVAVALGDAELATQLVREDPRRLEATMSPFEHRRRSLHLAVLKDRPEMVRLLVELGADLEARTDLGATALALAATRGKQGIVEALLELGAKVDLEAALALGRLEEARRLAALLSPEERAQSRALHFAAEAGLAAGVEVLIKAGFDPSARARIFNTDGITPLHLAAANGRLEVVRQLLDAGADLEARDGEFNETPAEWAAHYGHREVVDLIAAASRQGAVPP